MVISFGSGGVLIRVAALFSCASFDRMLADGSADIYIVVFERGWSLPLGLLVVQVARSAAGADSR